MSETTAFTYPDTSGSPDATLPRQDTASSRAPADLGLNLGRAERLYRTLGQPGVPASALSAQTREQARGYLQAQLALVESSADDLPDNPAHIGAWIDAGVAQTGNAYRAYLEQRKLGGARRFFPTRSHALHFLGAVAPTKLVDGSWLYGMASHWQDQRFMPLIRTYLEELGDGVMDKNHVALYRRLLALEECEAIGQLNDAHYVQGAIQLSLACLADDFLPEAIGFNLGYEQLPLHLLITAYELNELGIDPYYFTLHVTIDNAASGHAQQALRALEALMPHFGDAAEFYRRVRNGYKLNNLGASTMDIIDGFVLEDEVKSIFSNKAVIGSMVHSDYCRIGDRTVGEWLSDRSQIPAMLDTLQKTGWIKRHQSVENSRFWQLIQSERAAMFGVFTAYEQQVIADWIVGDAAALLPRPHSFRARQRLLERIAPNTAKEGAGNRNDADTDADMRAFEASIAAMENRADIMNLLVDAIGPNTHWSPSGLAATRLYHDLLSVG
ncbi:MAG TPA: iron-containing redox enzyme family protein [Herbaspirillum sp.]